MPARAVTVSAPAAAPVQMGAMPAGAYQPMTVGDWLLTFLIAAIPFAGIVMMFVWAFSSDTQPSKKNFFRASLILVGGVIVLLGLALALGLGSAMAAAAAGKSHQMQP